MRRRSQSSKVEAKNNGVRLARAAKREPSAQVVEMGEPAGLGYEPSIRLFGGITFKEKARMSAYKDNNFNDRKAAAESARKAAQAKFLAMPKPDDPAVLARQAEQKAIMEARAARAAEREVARQAELARLAAEDVKRLAEQAAREAEEAQKAVEQEQQALAMEAERKAARDARYAARQARRARR
jgi:Family of unknown function (DUF6481)